LAIRDFMRVPCPAARITIAASSIIDFQFSGPSGFAGFNETGVYARVSVVFLKFLDQSFQMSPTVDAASAASFGCRTNAAEAAFTEFGEGTSETNTLVAK
jgi:hypothetical protein